MNQWETQCWGIERFSEFGKWLARVQGDSIPAAAFAGKSNVFSQSFPSQIRDSDSLIRAVEELQRMARPLDPWRIYSLNAIFVVDSPFINELVWDTSRTNTWIWFYLIPFQCWQGTSYEPSAVLQIPGMEEWIKYVSSQRCSFTFSGFKKKDSDQQSINKHMRSFHSLKDPLSYSVATLENRRALAK